MSIRIALTEKSKSNRQYILVAVAIFFDRFFLQINLENLASSNNCRQILKFSTENISEKTLSLPWRRTRS